MADSRRLGLERPTMPVSARFDALQVYSSAVIAAGTVLLATALPDLRTVTPLWFAVLLVSEVLASLYKVSLQLPGGGATMTLGLAVGFAALLTVGAGPAAIIVSAGIWAQCTYRTESKGSIPLRQRLFSVACGAITVDLAARAYAGLDYVPGHLTRQLAGLSAASLVYFAVNTSLVAGAVALSKKRAFYAVWRDGFLWSGPSYFISAGTVGMALEIADHYGPLPLVLATAPLVLTYRAYKVYLGRVAEEQRQLRVARDYTAGIIHSMREMLLVVSPDGRITTTNAAACEALGFTEAELVGQPLDAVLVPVARPVHGLAASALPPLSQERERVLRTRHGNEIPVLFSTSPLAAGSDGPPATVCVALDIRDRIRMEQQERLHMERLQRQHAALADLARDRALHAGDFTAAARQLTAGPARMMRAARVDLWLFDGAAMTSTDSYDPATGAHAVLAAVPLDRVPGLTATLASERVVAVHADRDA
ncbi:MAG: PAS domain S-box protein, partial [Acidobacteria bacterium]|nr:PAS domain S-box protein [Acidobacteriota bacterium]